MSELTQIRPRQRRPQAAGRAARCQLRLSGRLDVAAMRRALSALVARHDVLRTAFAETDGELRPETVPPYPVDLTVERVRGANAERQAAVLKDPFDLDEGELLRARLLDLGPREHLLAIAVHEVAADRRSLEVMLSELAELYASGRTASGPPAYEKPLGVPRAARAGSVDRLTLEVPDVSLTALVAAYGLLHARDTGDHPVRFAVDERRSFRDLTALARPVIEEPFNHRAGVRVAVGEDDRPTLRLPGLRAEVTEIVADMEDCDLALRYRSGRLDMYYATDVLARATVERMATRLRVLLGEVSRQPDVPLARLPLCTPRERAEVLGWGDGGPDLEDTFVPVHELLAQVAAGKPEQPAVVTAERTVAFGELQREIERMAAVLAARGVGPESVVALCLPRGHELVAGIFAVLEAGGAYVPIDLSYPAERVATILADSGARLVLTHSSLAANIPGGTEVLTVDDTAESADLGARSSQTRRVCDERTQAGAGSGVGVGAGAGAGTAVVGPETVAYQIYTSGSTGRPKGVQITHGAVTNLLRSLEHAGIADSAAGRVGWNASVSFDASVQQWIRLCRGDTLVVLDEQTRSDPAALARTVVEQRLTALDITPSHLSLLVEHLRGAALDAPVCLLVGGEDIRPVLWRELNELERTGRARAVNLYGPTECTVDATAAWVRRSTKPHIGRPLPGARTYVLDAWLRPVPVGVTGDLYVAGPGLARGYRSRPGLTAERFVADVVAGDGSRMYRTGDRARWRDDGVLEFAGRADRQVKLRGYRVELGEIESVLGEGPDVVEAVVMVRDDLPSGEGLVAYCRGAASLDGGGLRRWLAERLPEFMIPSAFVVVERFPLTVNGKVDVRSLPPPREPVSDDGDRPVGPIEELVASVWSGILGVDHVGAHDNFFDLGGHSELAIRVVARLRRDGGVHIPMVAVFEHPRVRDLAGYISSRSGAGSQCRSGS